MAQSCVLSAVDAASSSICGSLACGSNDTFSTRVTLRASLPIRRHVIRAAIKPEGASKEEERVRKGPLPSTSSYNDPPLPTAPSADGSSSVDRIEHQARASIARLKDILYRVKTLPSQGEVPGNNLPSAGFTTNQREVYISKNVEEAKDINREGQEKAGPGGLSNSDALTCTRTSVNFDEPTQTAIVTVSATVRTADSVASDENRTDAAVNLAARALARTCISLYEKAQLAAKAGGLGSLVDVDHQSNPLDAPLLADLAHGTVVSAKLLPCGQFGSTPLRPVFQVTLSVEGTGSVEAPGTRTAVFKPSLPGDGLCRWERAPADFVAYQLASLLSFDFVPPCALRSNLTIQGRPYSSGVLLPHLTIHGAITPQAWSSVVDAYSSLPSSLAPLPSLTSIASDVHILDALMGNMPRQSGAFLAAEPWRSQQEHGEEQHGEEDKKTEAPIVPVIVEHPIGPGMGDLHAMWQRRGGERGPPGLKIVSGTTLGRLRALSRAQLLDSFNGSLSAVEIEQVLERRDQIVLYFDALISRHSREAVLV